MIINDIQYKVSQASLTQLSELLDTLPDSDDFMSKLQRDSITSQYKTLKDEVKVYDELKGGCFKLKGCLVMDELAANLISARIAKGISYEQLANTLGISEQQIYKYETNNYSGASLTRTLKIANALGFHITKILAGDGSSEEDVVFDEEELNELDWSQFPIKEISKKGWNYLQNSLQAPLQLKAFIENVMGPGLAPAFHRKTKYNGRTAKDYSLLAWQARVQYLANETLCESPICEFVLNDSWIPELVALSQEDNGPLLAKNFLAERGIVLIIEPHLEGTYLDGAAMLSESGTPIIGMTLRHDRIDNFWFVLMHELGHVFLHLFSNSGVDFIDEKVGDEKNVAIKNKNVEAEADAFALNNLIPPELWKKSVSRVMQSEKAINGDAKRMNVHKAIIAGRIRKEKNNYKLLKGFVGYNLVRKLFM